MTDNSTEILTEKSNNSASGAHQFLADMLLKVDVQIGGNRPWDIQVKSKDLAKRVLSRGNLGLGEAYMDGDWEANQLDEFFNRVLRARLDQELKPFGLGYFRRRFYPFRI